MEPAPLQGLQAALAKPFENLLRIDRPTAPSRSPGADRREERTFPSATQERATVTSPADLARQG
ncbi:MAG: hypothetical protein WCH37_07545, partial [Synechococcaceae cyanobacterium ELA182]